MEVLQESVLASGSPARSFRALLVNFRKMKTANAPADAVTEVIARCLWLANSLIAVN